MESESLDSRVEFCSECQVGIPRYRAATYYMWIGDEVVMVPNFPCWVCDVCGRREWDAAAQRSLRAILRLDAENIMNAKNRFNASKEAKARPEKKRVRRVVRS